MAVFEWYLKPSTNRRAWRIGVRHVQRGQQITIATNSVFATNHSYIHIHKQQQWPVRKASSTRQMTP